MKKIFISFLLLFSTSLMAQEDYRIEPVEDFSESEKVVVYNFFYYGCVHCMRMDNELEYLETMEGVEYVKVPIVFNDLSRIAAQHFYTAQVMGFESEFATDYYRNVVLQKNPISNVLAVTLMEHYAEKNMIKDNLNSNYVMERVNSAEELMRSYGITSTPTFVVNGSYLINAELSGGYENLKEDLNRIIESELE